MRIAEYVEYTGPDDMTPMPVYGMEISQDGLQSYSINALVELIRDHGLDPYRGYRPESITIQFQKGVLRDVWSFWYCGERLARLVELREGDE